LVYCLHISLHLYFEGTFGGGMHKFIYRRISGAALLLIGLAAPLGAATTGTDKLFTPQGGGATTPNGDYVSTTLGPYRYFIEVPSGLPRLVVDLYDADIGLGGTAEANAGRDRQRANSGNNDWDTTVTYSLVNPAGATRTPRFTTGSSTLPVGGDAAWLTFFDSTGDNVRDNFTTAAYTNNDGVVNWAGNWTETSDSPNGSASTGAVIINAGELQIGDNGAGGASTIDREANLLGAGFATATLSFNVRTTGVEATDSMQVQVSNNGGTSYTTLETFTGAVTAAVRSYNITSSIATNTRIRFIRLNGYAETDDLFFVDNVQIQETGIDAGHWEVRVDMSVTGGNDINAFGLRAHDGTPGAGGTELNVYYDSQNQFGVNPDPGANTRIYTVYPYLTSGCSASKNDFDYDSDSGNTGALSFTSRTGTFTQNYASALLSADDTWDRQTFSGWTSDGVSGQYGIWTAGLTINTYGSTSGNYTNLWMGNFQAAANPPAANPTANAFRVYLPTDSDVAPVKPYIDQTLTFTGCGGGNNGPNPPVVGQASCFTNTVRVVNPTAFPITFSTSNLVTANVPGTRVLYAGPALSTVSQGTILTQPAVNGSGNITWNPGTVAAGATALLAYRVKVTPTAAGQRNPMTAAPASGNGTRAQLVDETGNTTQTRSTYLFGPLCELATTVNAITEAVISDVHAWQDGGGVRVEWRTASETGTSGFYLDRLDRASRQWVRVSEALVPALQSAPQGGTYRFLDAGASPTEPQVYRLEEVEAGGRHEIHGPYALAVDWQRPAGMRNSEMAGMVGAYDRAARPATGRDGQGRALRIQPGAGIVAGGGAAGMHLTIRRSGLYNLRSSQIAIWLGLSQLSTEALIVAGQLELTRGGRPVAWMPDFAAPPGTPGSPVRNAQGLFFYGEALDGVYAQGSVYRLRRGKGLPMATRTAPPSALKWATAKALGDGDFPETLHAEKDAFPATVLNLDPESDYWFWDFLVAGDATYGHHSFSVDAPGLATAAAAGGTLTVSLQGATDSGVGANVNEHHALVSLNGTFLGETSWKGITAHGAAFDVPPGLLRESANAIEVTAALDAGIPYSIVYVDAFDLSYRRTLRAPGDALAFTASTPGGDMTVGGFSAPEVRLLDVRDPLRPVWISGAAVAPETAGGTYALRFAADAGVRYLAAAPPGFPIHAAVRAWSAPSLLAGGNRADYLVVAPAVLHSAAQRLADLRHSRGLEAQVVDLELIYDELNYGAPSPHAIHDFLSYAWRSWSLRPRYAVLAGAGSLDYRNLLGFGDCLVPPLLVRSQGGLFPSDNDLADVNFDGLPEMAVGRLPVLSAAGLDAYTAKIAAYEAGGAEAWTRNALFLSDTTDGATDFATDSNRVAAQIGSPLGASYTVETIDLQSTPLAAARAWLLSRLGSGASLINYMGHGALDRISSGGLLTNADAAALTNGDRLPVFTAMTCTINRFTVPGLPSLGEALVGQPAGGVAAVWGPSGLAANSQSRLLAETFYRSLSNPANLLLGDHILRALGEFRVLGGDGTLFSTYNLLGDPALRLRRPPAPPAGGGTSGE